MYKIITLIFLLITFPCFIKAQELNCQIKINSDRIAITNKQIFITLEKSLSDFVNNTKWSNQNFLQNEKIDCSMFINISEYAGDTFVATIQVQSSRPIYNTTYLSPVFNFNDKDFVFRYIEFESFLYNPNNFDSNLVSVVAFYANIILGIDADTFVPEGGTKYYETALNIANIAQQTAYKGWKQTDGNQQNRYFLINDIVSNTFISYREVLYEYHYMGLDRMTDDQKQAKEMVKKAIATLDNLNKVRPNAFLMRIFFDAKTDEIVSIFSEGPKIETADLLNNLNKFSPMNSMKWSRIK